MLHLKYEVAAAYSCSESVTKNFHSTYGENVTLNRQTGSRRAIGTKLNLTLQLIMVMLHIKYEVAAT